MAFIVKVVRVSADGTKTLTKYNPENNLTNSLDNLSDELLQITAGSALDGQLPLITGYIQVGDEDNLELGNVERLKAKVPAFPGRGKDFEDHIVIIGQGTTEQQLIDGLNLPEEKRPLSAEALQALNRYPVYNPLRTLKPIQQWKKRFGENVWKFFTHPGTWVFFALLMVAMAMAFPFSAPALIVAALTFTAAATLSLIPYTIRYVQKLLKEAEAAGYPPSTSSFRIAFEKFKEWVIGHPGVIGHPASRKEGHPIQAILVGLGLALFATALILTVGFFTGGAAFAFMAPVFAAIAAPLVTAATVAGVAVSPAALTAVGAGLFILATLNLANIAKRVFEFIDGFRWKNHGDIDYPMTKVDEDQPANAFEAANKAVDQAFTETETYLSEVAAGMKYVAKSIFSPTGPYTPDSGNARDEDIQDEYLLDDMTNSV